jgi:hypothetical protein
MHAERQDNSMVVDDDAKAFRVIDDLNFIPGFVLIEQISGALIVGGVLGEDFDVRVVLNLTKYFNDVEHSQVLELIIFVRVERL